jgi:hypothetical protein
MSEEVRHSSSYFLDRMSLVSRFETNSLKARDYWFQSEKLLVSKRETVSISVV